MSLYRNYIKTLLDQLLSFSLLVVLLPIIIVLIIVLIFNNGGTPFFFQSRPGKNGVIFKVIKFKTMNDKRDETGNLLPDSDRLSNVGRIYRKYSLDEIPQLFNVLKGDMSFIGPRPLLPEYLPKYSAYHRRRHEVKPGITGWAQVNGRNTALFSQRFNYDVWYVDNISFKLDFRIVIMTVKKVIFGDGVVSGQNVLDVDDLGFNKKL